MSVAASTLPARHPRPPPASPRIRLATASEAMGAAAVVLIDRVLDTLSRPGTDRPVNELMRLSDQLRGESDQLVADVGVSLHGIPALQWRGDPPDASPFAPPLSDLRAAWCWLRKWQCREGRLRPRSAPERAIAATGKRERQKIRDAPDRLACRRGERTTISRRRPQPSDTQAYADTPSRPGAGGGTVREEVLYVEDAVPATPDISSSRRADTTNRASFSMMGAMTISYEPCAHCYPDWNQDGALVASLSASSTATRPGSPATSRPPPRCSHGPGSTPQTSTTKPRPAASPPTGRSSASERRRNGTGKNSGAAG
jgi:hypothetical protein